MYVSVPVCAFNPLNRPSEWYGGLMLRVHFYSNNTIFSLAHSIYSSIATARHIHFFLATDAACAISLCPYRYWYRELFHSFSAFCLITFFRIR